MGNSKPDHLLEGFASSFATEKKKLVEFSTYPISRNICIERQFLVNPPEVLFWGFKSTFKSQNMNPD